MNNLRLWSVATLMVAALLMLGCGGEGPAYVPVTGTVTLDGKPLSSGNVITQPAGGRGANATIQPDGTFKLRSRDQDGALIGTHKVAVVAYQQQAGAGPEAPAGKPLVPERYLNPETSDLTIDVKEGSNEPELKLTSP